MRRLFSLRRSKWRLFLRSTDNSSGFIARGPTNCPFAQNQPCWSWRSCCETPASVCISRYGLENYAGWVRMVRCRRPPFHGIEMVFLRLALWLTGSILIPGKAVAVRVPPLHPPVFRSRVSMPEAPIETVGVVREVLPGPVFHVELPNGKMVYGHLPRRLADLSSDLAAGERVMLQMTPFDFEKARIAGHKAEGMADE